MIDAAGIRRLDLFSFFFFSLFVSPPDMLDAFGGAGVRGIRRLDFFSFFFFSLFVSPPDMLDAFSGTGVRGIRRVDYPARALH